MQIVAEGMQPFRLLRTAAVPPAGRCEDRKVDPLLGDLLGFSLICADGPAPY